MISINEGIELTLAIIGLASVIVKLTPTPKDNEILAKIIRFVSMFIALNPKNDSVDIKIKK